MLGAAFAGRRILQRTRVCHGHIVQTAGRAVQVAEQAVTNVVDPAVTAIDCCDARRPARSSSDRRCVPVRSTFSSQRRSMRPSSPSTSRINGSCWSRTSWTWRSQLSANPSDARGVGGAHASAPVVAAHDHVLDPSARRSRTAAPTGSSDRCGRRRSRRCGGRRAHPAASRRSGWRARGCRSIQSRGTSGTAVRPATRRTRGRVPSGCATSGGCSLEERVKWGHRVALIVSATGQGWSGT